MADGGEGTGSRKRARRGRQGHVDAASSREPARKPTSRPTAAEEREALEIISAMRDADVDPPLVKRTGRQPEPRIVACALALERGEKFVDDAAACRAFDIHCNYDVQGVWLHGKLAQLRAYQQQQLVAAAHRYFEACRLEYAAQEWGDDTFYQEQWDAYNASGKVTKAACDICGLVHHPGAGLLCFHDWDDSPACEARDCSCAACVMCAWGCEMCPPGSDLWFRKRAEQLASQRITLSMAEESFALASEWLHLPRDVRVHCAEEEKQLLDAVDARKVGRYQYVQCRMIGTSEQLYGHASHQDSACVYL